MPVWPAAAKEKPLVKRVWATMLKRNSLTNRKPFQLARPVIDGEQLFVGVHRGVFYSLNKRNGKRFWKFKMSGAIQMEAAVDNVAVYAGDTKGNLYALKKENGALLWVTGLDGELLAKPLLTADAVFVVTIDQTLSRLDLKTGQIVWQQKRDIDTRRFSIRKSADPVLVDGELWVGFADGSLNAYRPEDGKSLWSHQIGNRFEAFHDQDATIHLTDGRGVLSSADGRLELINLKTRKSIWESDVGGVNQSVSVQGQLYVAANGVLRALQAENGQTLWEYDFEVPEISAPILYKESVIVAGTEGKIHVLDRKTGNILFDWYIRGGALSDPVLDENRIYLLSNAARVYSFQFRE